MGARTTESTVTFRHPFKLSVLDAAQPAGIYRLVIEEELIPDVSFLAWRRTATMLHTPALFTSGESGQVVTITPEELAEALQTDRDAPAEA